jgi:phage terminase small subunit
LGKVRVRQAIQEAQARRAARVEVQADDVLRELLRIARADIAQAFDESGALLPVQEMPEDVRRAIASIEVEQVGGDDGAVSFVKKVRFWDKSKGLELLGKHLKLFTDKVELSGKVTLEQLVLGSFEKPPGGHP